MARATRYKYERPSEKMEMPPVENDKGKQKKIILLIIVAAFGVLLMGLLGYYIIKGKKIGTDIGGIEIPNVTTVENATSGTTTMNCYDDECFMKLAVDENNIDACGRVLDSNKMETCYESISKTSLDACLKVTDEQTKKECLTVHAIEQKSVALCKNIAGGEQKSCIEKIEPCYYKTGNELLLCLALDKDDYKLCNKNEECITTYAKTKNESIACKELGIASSQNTCISIAMQKDICGDLATAPEKDKCRMNYVIATKDAEACQKITQDTIYSQECYTNVALDKMDKNYCSYLSLDYKWNCLINYSKTAPDLSACDLIPDYLTKSRQNCGFAYATTTFDPRGCLYITSAPTYKKSCYERIFFVDTTGLTYEKCAIVDLEDWKNRCYTTIGKRDMDINACSYISEDAEKKLCEGTVRTEIEKSANSS